MGRLSSRGRRISCHGGRGPKNWIGASDLQDKPDDLGADASELVAPHAAVPGGRMMGYSSSARGRVRARGDGGQLRATARTLAELAMGLPLVGPKVRLPEACWSLCACRSWQRNIHWSVKLGSAQKRRIRSV